MLHSGKTYATTNQSRWASAANSKSPYTGASSGYNSHYSHFTRPEASSAALPDASPGAGPASYLTDPALRQIDEFANSMDVDSEVSGNH